MNPADGIIFPQETCPLFPSRNLLSAAVLCLCAGAGSLAQATQSTTAMLSNPTGRSFRISMCQPLPGFAVIATVSAGIVNLKYDPLAATAASTQTEMVLPPHSTVVFEAVNLDVKHEVQRMHLTIRDTAVAATEAPGLLEYWAYRNEAPPSWMVVKHGGVFAKTIPAAQGFSIARLPGSLNAVIGSASATVENKAELPGLDKSAAGLLPEPNDGIWQHLHLALLTQLRPDLTAVPGGGDGPAVASSSSSGSPVLPPGTLPEPGTI